MPLNKKPLGYQRFATVAAPASAPTDDLAGAGAGLLSNGVYSYKVTYVTSQGETLPSAASGGVTVADAASDGKVALTAIPVSADPNVTARKLYRTIADGATYKLLTTIANNTATTYTDNIADASLGAEPPAANAATGLKDAQTLTIPSGAGFLPTRCLLQAETQNVRWRDDGTAPTATVGTLISKDALEPYEYTGNLASLRLIEVTTSAVLNVTYYA